MFSTTMQVEQVREVVARELEARGIGDAPFYREIREGRRDNSPFMIGAIAMVLSQEGDESS